MPTPIDPNALNATISAVSLVVKGQTAVTLTLGQAITNYAGERLHFQAVSDGTTLLLNFSEDPLGSSDVSQRASQATAVVNYGGVPHSTLPQPFAFTAGTTLFEHAQINSDLSTPPIVLQLSVDDQKPTGHTGDKDDPNLGYVLLSDPVVAGRTPTSTIYWINPIYVQTYATRNNLKIVAPNQSGGGIVGPMGIEVPPPGP